MTSKISPTTYPPQSQAFDLPWEKVQETHASVMLLARVPRLPWQVDDLKAAVATIQIGRKAARWIERRLGDEKAVLGRQDVAAFLDAGLMKRIDGFVEEHGILPQDPIDPGEELRTPQEWVAKLNAPVTAVDQKKKQSGLTVFDGGKTDDN